MATDRVIGPLNDCGCCSGIEQETPQAMWNRPGLSAIAYRVGTHQQFKASLLARLHSSRQAALNALQTRQNDDFTIALLDAFSTVADVLTFYSERIANEAYLRTATERQSVLQLAQLIGYQLRPGVAANAFLAFTIDDAPGALAATLLPPTTAQVQPEAPPTITIDVGTKVQSVPGPGETPQSFETIEKISARAEWNSIRPRLTQPQVVSASSRSFILAGAIASLKKGDKILIADGSNSVVASILNVTVTTDPTSIGNDNSTTQIDVAVLTPGAPGYNPASYTSPSLPQGSIEEFAPGTELDDAVVQTIISEQWDADALIALAKIQNWPLDQLAININQQIAQFHPNSNSGVWVFRQRAAAFGYNAPRWDSLRPELRYTTTFYKYDPSTQTYQQQVVPAAYPEPGWENLKLDYFDNCSGNQCALYVDSTYPEITSGSWIALLTPGVPTGVASVTNNREVSHSDFTLSAKVSLLTIGPPTQPLSSFSIRETAVLCQSELLPLAPVPIVDLVQGNIIVLDRAYLGLTAGRKVVISGEREDLPGVTAAEVHTLQEVTLQGGFTVITLDSQLDHSYVRSEISINANVALSTNGETIQPQEILGSSDGAQVFQSFVLQQSPLTCISADTPSGIQSTLEVRVDDLLWQEVPFFYGHGPEEHIYITRQDDSGKTTVMFGDGVTGSRLPTSQQNIKAKYRRGIGLGGLVRANQLSLLLTRPLGVKAANNPLPATGAADAENLEDARRNATLTIMTLGRIVSLQDYEDFARAFAGIGKAFVTWTWSGQQRIVLLTVAGANGAGVLTGSTLYGNLLKAINLYSEPFVSVLLYSYEPIFFRIAGSVTVKPDFVTSKVAAAVETALRTSFSFEERAFGQPVHLSEVIATIQNVPGVVDVDLNQFYRSDLNPDLVTHIAAAVPHPGKNEFFPAQLLTLDSRPLGLEVTQ